MPAAPSPVDARSAPWPPLPTGVAQAGFEHPVELAGMAEEVRPLVVLVPRTVYTGSFYCLVTVRDEAGTYQLTRAIELLGPDPKLLQEDEDGPERDHH